MVPSFAASSMLVYEWFQDQEETRLLIYAILCLLVGVVGGMFIVHHSSAVSAEAEKERQSKESAKSRMDMEMEEFQKATIIEAADLGWSSGFSEAVPDSVLAAVRDAKSEIPAIDKRAVDAGRPQVIEKQAQSEKIAARVATPSAAAASMSLTGSGGHTIALGARSAALGEVIALGAGSGDSRVSEPPALDFSPVSAPAETSNPEPPNHASAIISEEFAFLAEASAEDEQYVAEETVERAQAVVARLEAEVAKAEVVAAKLESELAKAEPVAAMLSAESESTGTVNFAFVFASSSMHEGFDGEPKQLPEFERAEDWLAYAAQMVHDQNFDDAIKCYDKVSVIDNKNFDAWYLKSVALRRKGRCEDAIYCVNYALSLRSNDARALTEKGECLLQLNKNEQALSWFEKAISADESNARSWCGKARSLAAANKHKEAIQSYEKVLSLDPNNEEAIKAKGESAKKVERV